MQLQLPLKYVRWYEVYIGFSQPLNLCVLKWNNYSAKQWKGLSRYEYRDIKRITVRGNRTA